MSTFLRIFFILCVDKKYTKYLSKFEKHVSYNKDETDHSRPYLGIVLKIDNYNYNEQDKKYKDLISAEYRYINSNKEEIYKRANKMYIAVTKHKNNFLKTISCNFKLLEEKCVEYEK